MLKGKDVYVLNLSRKYRNNQMKLIKLVKIKQFWSAKVTKWRDKIYKLTIIVCAQRIECLFAEFISKHVFKISEFHSISLTYSNDRILSVMTHNL